MRAYDPTDKVIRPQKAYHPNIFYYNIGLSPINGKSTVGKGGYVIPVKTLDTLLKENGDYGKQITYLKIDIEGTEIPCMKQWLKSGVVKFIDQLGIEMHTSVNQFYNAYMNGVIKSILKFLREILVKQKLYLVDYNPNLCIGKSSDKAKKYYSYHDLLFIRKI